MKKLLFLCSRICFPKNQNHNCSKRYIQQKCHNQKRNRKNRTNLIEKSLQKDSNNYKQKLTTSYYPRNNYHKKISSNWHKKLKENFTGKEIYNSVKDASEDSASRKDGLLMKLYCTQWYLIKEDFTDAVNGIFFEKREIAKRMKRAIIMLISKTTKEETNPAKWGPISLLIC